MSSTAESDTIRAHATDWRRGSGRSSIAVVVFSGGRGSGVLSTQLITNPGVALTIAVNGYDDGASTGEVRRFLGDSLGPSDYRKNASRVARALSSCSGALIGLMDVRLPVGCTVEAASALFDLLMAGRVGHGPAADPTLLALSNGLRETERLAVAERLGLFRAAHARAGRPFQFSDCSIGNLVFAGSFLRQGRRFNDAVDDYCTMMGLPAGLIENVTDGTNAYLVALDDTARLLGTEEEIVSTGRPTRIRDIYLVDRPLDADEHAALMAAPPGERGRRLAQRAPALPANPRLMQKIADADLIIYAPGTQHSSLFPSYLTSGVSDAIARNTSAVKLLITNIQTDAEIPDSSAVDIIERALYYMSDRGRRTLLTPALITHYLVNEPGHQEVDQPYVPLGSLDRIEDPRLVRIGDFEDGVSGRHDATKVLTPFVASLLGPPREPRIAVYLHDASSPNKIAQTILEMVRGGVESLPVALTVIHAGPALDPEFVAMLPLRVVAPAPEAIVPLLSQGSYDYVILFESSGMYRGEDVVGLASQVLFLRLDAVWGSRRLSPKDIDAAYRLRYRHRLLLGSVSRVGSHLLSALYLALYGRYITDSLSGARAVRCRYLRELDVDPGQKPANHQLLGALLRDGAEVLETPVAFFPMSPARVKRTSVLDGLRAAWTILGRRFRARPAPEERA